MKRIKRLIVAGIVLVIVVVVAAVVWIDRLAKAGIETGATYALGVQTTLDKAAIGILSGHSGLSGLQVANPAGFESAHFLKLGDGVLDVSLGSLTKDTIEVPKFSLTGIDVNLEKKAGKANYQVIMDNLGRFESHGDKPSGQPQGQTEQAGGRKFIIREIVIKDVKVHVDVLPIGGSLARVTVPIDELRLKDVGSDSNKGVLLTQLTDTLLKAIMAATIEKGGGLIPADVLGDLTAGLKNLDSLKNVGATLAVSVGGKLQDVVNQGTREITEKLGDTAKTAAEGITGKIGDILGKKPDARQPK